MPRLKKAEPEVHIEDLHPVNDGFVHAYTGTWAEQGIIIHVVLDIVDVHHWQPGRYLQNAYELVALNPTTVSGRPLGAGQEETASILQHKLRERMLDLMKVAGWCGVAFTRNRQPIYQYRPTTPAQQVILEQKQGVVVGDPETDVSAQGEQQDLGLHTKDYVVYGSEEARKGGAAPAFTRKVSMKTTTFDCKICGNTVTQQHYPGQAPCYCGSEACKREGTRRRVQKSREKQTRTKQTTM